MVYIYEYLVCNNLGNGEWGGGGVKLCEFIYIFMIYVFCIFYV